MTGQTYAGGFTPDSKGLVINPNWQKHGPLPILDVPDDTSVPRRPPGSSSSGKKTPPYAYLSVVDGKPMRHATWAECERRVKGRSGARFKKAMTEADEATILREWGCRPEDL